MQGFVKNIEKGYLFFKDKKKYQCRLVIGNSALFPQPTHSLFTPQMVICASYFAEMKLFSTNFWKENSTLQRWQEKSYPGEIVPKRNRTQLEWVRFHQRYRTQGTISPEISYLFVRYNFDVYCTVEKYT